MGGLVSCRGVIRRSMLREGGRINGEMWGVIGAECEGVEVVIGKIMRFVLWVFVASSEIARSGIVSRNLVNSCYISLTYMYGVKSCHYLVAS